MNKLPILAILLLLIYYQAIGQAAKTPRYQNRPQEIDRGATYENKKVKTKKNKANALSLDQQFNQKVDEYYARMEENSKRYKKFEKDMRKPQFSDPSYFGHKRPPKKRPPGKKKFCKECGMVH
ncbi:MAG TPA: hypothetical protein VI583_10095 [Cyclobacteriaceae bacterium]|nr:hypothetical protein [Cyclobacteriaceae bacterium]